MTDEKDPYDSAAEVMATWDAERIAEFLWAAQAQLDAKLLTIAAAAGMANDVALLVCREAAASSDADHQKFLFEEAKSAAEWAIMLREEAGSEAYEQYLEERGNALTQIKFEEIVSAWTEGAQAANEDGE